MTTILFETLAAGLKLWGTKEANKYKDQVIKLRRIWDEEYNKPPGERSNAVLDNVERELRILAIAFSSKAGTPDA